MIFFPTNMCTCFAFAFTYHAPCFSQIHVRTLDHIHCISFAHHVGIFPQLCITCTRTCDSMR